MIHHSASSSTNRRTAFILVDGVPFAVMQRIYENGALNGFKPPKPVISTFPSLTDPALRALFGWERVESYGSFKVDKNNHFLRRAKTSNRRNRLDDLDFITSELSFRLRSLMGETQRHYPTPSPGMATMARGALRLLGYASKTFIDFELNEAERILCASPKRHVRIVINSLDDICHREGLEGLDAGLSKFTDWLGHMCRVSGRDAAIISDHGNAPTRFKFFDYADALSDKGFSVAIRPFKRADILMPLYGAINFFPVYVRKIPVQEVARTLARMPGVDFVAYRNANRDEMIYLLRKEELSTVRHEEGRCWYGMSDGDVLDYAEALPAHSLDVSGNGEITVSDWLSATKEHHYPNGPERLVGAYDHVVRPPEILVSLEQDYVYGLRLAYQLYPSLCMHGNLLREASEGFVMLESGYPIKRDLPDALRLEDLQRHLSIV